MAQDIFFFSESQTNSNDQEEGREALLPEALLPEALLPEALLPEALLPEALLVEELDARVRLDAAETLNSMIDLLTSPNPRRSIGTGMMMAEHMSRRARIIRGKTLEVLDA